jgi:SSS family solute:Na+ symporter
VGGRAGGFFALPYTILVFPFVFLVMPRLWSVANRHRYITAADYVKGRYSSRTLATAVAFTGLLATMPYIALQLVGIQVVLGGLGIDGTGRSSSRSRSSRPTRTPAACARRRLSRSSRTL